MMSLDAFKAGLTEHMRGQSALRPFVCDGSPLECRAFIVGFNPATESTADFWRFWQDDRGFDKQAWLTHYKEERQRRPLKPGQQRRLALSPSRRVIEWIIHEAHPVAVLETNIHALATATQAGLAKAHQQTDTFDFLMKSIAPAVIVTHGNKARDYVVGKGYRDKVIDVPHFSRGWSEVAARELGQRIRWEAERVNRAEAT